jgi:Uma2 family endonuclease
MNLEVPMNVPAPAVKRLSADEFLAWVGTQDQGKFELLDGEIIAMAPERVAHAHSKAFAWRALAAAIQAAGLPCQAFVELGVKISDDTTYVPDALVNCGPPLSADVMLASNPVIVVEVLSPSTRHIDKARKLADYFTRAELHHYVIIDLSKRHVLHYRRQAEGGMVVHIVTEGSIKLDPPGITIEHADLFA